jgi:glycosyltransferase involved in cell wall biosynthesis
MKIVFVNKQFSEKLGYSDFFLCKALARKGHEIHLITSQYQLQKEFYNGNYEAFLGPLEQPLGVKQFEGFTLHRLYGGIVGKVFYTRGLVRKVRELAPDVVVSSESIKFDTLRLALARPFLKYKFFTEDHVHLSVFPPAHSRLSILNKFKFWLYRQTAARFLNCSIEKCYTIAPDTTDIMVDYFGIDPKKIKLAPLVSDTDWFHPATGDAELAERRQIRHELGVADDEILCIYTGRFTNGKDPACLAMAVDKLQTAGEPFKAVFFGSGREQYDTIKNCKGCMIHPFVLARELPKYYRAADVGVWPRQESTSQLDAMATGMPIIISSKVQADERHEGNGLTYEEGDRDSLAQALLALKSPAVRRQLGDCSIAKIKKDLNWDFAAQERLADFMAAVQQKND